jgi:hypothetical protein
LPGSWDKAIETYRRLRGIKRSNFQTVIGMTLMEKNATKVEETIAAGIPVNFDRAVSDGQVQAGDLVLMAAFAHAGDFAAQERPEGRERALGLRDDGPRVVEPEHARVQQGSCRRQLVEVLGRVVAEHDVRHAAVGDGAAILDRHLHDERHVVGQRGDDVITTTCKCAQVPDQNWPGKYLEYGTAQIAYPGRSW